MIKHLKTFLLAALFAGASAHAAQQVINTGTTANDGTGDTVRQAFSKSNANFTELYSVKANIASTLAGYGILDAYTKDEADARYVQSVTCGTGLTGGVITSIGVCALAPSGVTAGSYGSASAVPVITIDTYGRATAASTAALTKASVGLGNVDNTSDANKPVSTAQAAAISAAQSAAASDATSKANAAAASAANASNLTSGTVAAARGGAGTVNGILKANGSGVVSQAVSGTDYAPATSGTAIQKANGSGGFTAATAGTDYLAPTGDGSLLTFTATGGVAVRTFADWAADRINVRSWGARLDYLALGGCSIASGSTALNCPSAYFTASDVTAPAKIVVIDGAGTSGSPLTASIASVTDSKNVVLSVAASTTVSLARASYGHDDSAGWAAAITTFNSLAAAGKQSCIYFPPGYSLIATGTSIPTFQNAQCIEGDGFNTSVVVVAPTFSQTALFNVSEAWQASSYPVQGPTVTYPSTDRSGPTLSGIGIIGWSNGSPFDAFVAANRIDFLTLRDVQFSYIPGRAIYLGKLDTTALPGATLAYTRESQFYNVRVIGSGLQAPGSVEISSDGPGTGDATNQLQFYGMNIFFPQSAGLVVRNKQTAKGIGNIRFYGLRVEGTPSPAINGDLIQIGDTNSTYSGGINNLQFYGLILNLPYNGYAGMKFQQPTGVSAAQPYNIDVFGTMTSSNTGGLGINIQSGRDLHFWMTDLVSSGTGLTIASSATVGTGILFSMYGRESAITYNVDSTTLRTLNRYVFATGLPSTSTNQGNGNSNTFCSSSLNSNCSQNGASALGGQAITSDGQFSTGIGLYASALTRYGIFSQASGQFAAPGDAQITNGVLRGSGTSASPIRLTTNGSTANNTAGTANIWNIGLLKTFGGDLTVACRNVTTPGSSVVARWNAVSLDRDNGAPVLGISSATTPDIVRPRGTAGFTWSVTVDGTNNGINVTATPPNTDTWRCAMRISDVEVGG